MITKNITSVPVVTADDGRYSVGTQSSAATNTHMLLGVDVQSFLDLAEIVDYVLTHFGSDELGREQTFMELFKQKESVRTSS